ncbi:polyprenyl glycosylphosphotransferase [Cellulomonas xylanilytica]|uniref:Polyprenyl glycosylphosphotransferase n=1 Tax=Cellulomonas xylanilytica TaxID=233583 RepID=A0A510V8A0_9CELL|nr:polyprenyl glycosylphosphotransferase [Cellulomonas xylanilytica]
MRFDSGLASVSGEFSPSYLSVSVVLASAWLVALAIGRTRHRRVVGSGPAEYSRVFGVTWRLFAAVAVIAYLLRMEIGRGYLGFAAPLGLALVMAGRFGWRRWLQRRREAGDFKSGLLVIGHRDKAARLIDELHRSPHAGYGVVGVCVPTGEVAEGEKIRKVPVLGSMESAARVAQEIGASAVAVTGADAITSETVRRLGWDLEGKGIDLALTLTLLDVAGPRVMMQPVSGLPLMYVDEPRFTGGRYILKSVFDWVGAALITVLISPLLLVLAILVATTSRGPVFYTQERIGKDGRRFRMIKFRSMVSNAHDRLSEVLALEGVESVGLFYKPKNDPRVTKVGAVLRKYSLDELPQLFNVLRGDMSLVGPRPQIGAEVALYDRTAHRRLLVKPGLTGLWQVSGRSGLSVEQGIRMDVNYVENWTLFGDVLIVARTVKVVLTGDGAR